MALDVLEQGGGEGVSAPYPIRQEADIWEEERDFYLPLINLIMLTGLKGASKTTNLARFGMMALALWHRPVFSDFPLGGKLLGVDYEADPLPDDALVNYCQGLPDFPVIVLDEAQEFLDRQEWYSTKSKQGISMAQQVRKLGVLIIGATQFFHYLNGRLNDQVDILIRCQDLFYTPWGKAEGIARGREAVLEYYDLSGAITGVTARNTQNTHYISGEPYYEELVFTEPYHRFFDTRRLTAIEQRFKKYQIEKEIVKVRRNGGRQEMPEGDELGDAIDAVFGHLGFGVEIDGVELRKMLYTDGFTIGGSALGQKLADMGIRRKSTKQGMRYFRG